MKKNMLVLVMFILSPYINAQKGEITIDANNKKISYTKNNLKKYSVESLIDFFYNNIHDVKKIDEIINFINRLHTTSLRI